MPLLLLALLLSAPPAEQVAVLLDRVAADDPPVVPAIVVEPNPSTAPHEHAVFIEMGETPPRYVSVSLELDGALRAVPVKRRLAAAVLVIASAFVKGPAGPAVAPWVNIAAQQIVTPGQRVLVIPGRSLEPLGDGSYLLTFRCVHDSPLDPRVRVTVRAEGHGDDDPWEIRTPWRPLAAPGLKAGLHDE